MEDLLFGPALGMTTAFIEGKVIAEEALGRRALAIKAFDCSGVISTVGSSHQEGSTYSFGIGVLMGRGMLNGSSMLQVFISVPLVWLASLGG